MVYFPFARHLTGMENPNSPLSQTLARYVPDFEPHFVNLTAMSDEAVQGEIVTRLFMLVLKHIFEELTNLLFYTCPEKFCPIAALSVSKGKLL